MTFDNPEETFDRIIRRENLGTRLTDEEVIDSVVLNALLADGNRIINNLIDNSNGTLPSPHIYFVNSSSINAFAFKEADEYFIGINEGTVLLMKNLFFRMLAHPNIFPNIGDCSKEITPPKITGIDINDANRIRREERRFPVDNTRNQFAVALTFYVFRFLLMHEYGHIINGHIDYFKDREDNPIIIENEANIIDVGDDWVRQSIEIDADDYSAQLGLNVIKADLTILNNNGTSSNDGITTPEIAAFAYYFSIAALFRLVGSKEYHPSNFYTSLYPPPAIRIYFIGFVLQESEAIRQWQISGDSYLNASFECETAFMMLSSEPTNFHHVMLAYGPGSDGYIDDIFTKFDRVYEVISPYAKMERKRRS